MRISDLGPPNGLINFQICNQAERLVRRLPLLHCKTSAHFRIGPNLNSKLQKYSNRGEHWASCTPSLSTAPLPNEVSRFSNRGVCILHAYAYAEKIQIKYINTNNIYICTYMICTYMYIHAYMIKHTLFKNNLFKKGLLTWRSQARRAGIVGPEMVASSSSMMPASPDALPRLYHIGFRV